MAIQFLFPSNRILPIDRRTTACACSVLVFTTRRFLFKHQVPIVEYIDFDVLLLLAAIMVVNHIVVHLKETKKCIAYVQGVIQRSPIHGFWLISALAFLISPFLTNDGVCLLMVEVILNAFADAPSVAVGKELSKADSIWFLLTLACSSNIGSALTYTGNPQNMIASIDALSVMSPVEFLGIQILPSLVSWVITTLYIQRCWMQSKKESSGCCGVKIMTTYRPVDGPGGDMEGGSTKGLREVEVVDNEGGAKIDVEPAVEPIFSLAICGREAELPSVASPVMKRLVGTGTGNPLHPNGSSGELGGVLSPRKQRMLERQAQAAPKVSYFIKSPAPYIGLVLLAAMIVMVFVDVMSLSALICISALIMVLSMVLGNHYRGQTIWNEVDEEHKGEVLSADERIEVIQHFFEELFASIDYNLVRLPTAFCRRLMPYILYFDILSPPPLPAYLYEFIFFPQQLIIFTGLFVVCANTVSTGLPSKMWAAIVGPQPFRTPASVVAIR